MDTSNSRDIRFASYAELVVEGYADSDALAEELKATVRELLNYLKPYLRHVVQPSIVTRGEEYSAMPKDKMRTVIISDCAPNVPGDKYIPRKLLLDEGGHFLIAAHRQTEDKKEFYSHAVFEDLTVANQTPLTWTWEYFCLESLVDALKRVFDIAEEKHREHTLAMSAVVNKLQEMRKDSLQKIQKALRS